MTKTKSTEKLSHLCLIMILFALSPASAEEVSIAPRDPANAVPAALPVTWTGFYIGGDTGYGIGKSDTLSINVTEPIVSGKAIVDSHEKGVILGGHAGYNQQYGSYVFGIEGDISGSIGGSADKFDSAIGRFEILYPLHTLTENSINSFSTIRIRAGIIFYDNLIYATGGYALIHEKIKTSFNLAGFPVYEGALEHNNTDYVVGAGIEHALNMNWSIRCEYLYAIGKSWNKYTLFGLLGNANYAMNDGFQIVKIGFNYKL